MLDIGWTELLVIAVVLIVVVGPKDLPPMLRAFGKMTSNLRKMAGDFRTQFDEALREADMDGVRQTIDDAKRFHPANAIREAINPLREMGNEIRNDLHKATELPGSSAADATGVANSAPSVEDLIPAPPLSLPEVSPLAATNAPSIAAPVTPVSGAPAGAAATPSQNSAAPPAARTPAPSQTPAPASASAPSAGTSPASAPLQSANEAGTAVKAPRARKSAAASLAAPAVPAEVVVEQAAALPAKRTRARKTATELAAVSEPAKPIKTSVKKTAAVRKVDVADGGATDQVAAPGSRKKKTPASKDQA